MIKKLKNFYKNNRIYSILMIISLFCLILMASGVVIYFVNQTDSKPPKFVFHVNSKSLVHFSYERYLENKIRESFDLDGSPIILQFKNRGEE